MRYLDKVLALTFALAGICLAALVGLQFAIIAGRFVFSFNFAWAQEGAVYLHACAVVLGIAWTLRKGRHVRIDVFDRRIARHSVDAALGALTAVAALALLYLSLPYAAASWAIAEGSREIGGLPGLFLLKSLVPLLALLLAIAAVLRLVVGGRDSSS